MSYISGDPATVSKYALLFSEQPKDAKPIRFVTFQQVIMQQLVVDVTTEELAATKQYMDTCHRDMLAAQDQPWESLDGELESDKRQKYITTYVFHCFLRGTITYDALQSNRGFARNYSNRAQ